MSNLKCCDYEAAAFVSSWGVGLTPRLSYRPQLHPPSCVLQLLSRQATHAYPSLVIAACITALHVALVGEKQNKVQVIPGLIRYSWHIA